MSRDQLLDMVELFEEAPVYMTVLEGPELRCTMVNRLVRETARGAELVGGLTRDLYPPGNPIIPVLERVYATGKPETIDGLPPYYADGAHGERFFTRTFVPLRDGQGGVRGVLTLAYEVTEQVRERIAQRESQRRSEAELQRLFALLEEAPLLISVLEGPEMRIGMMNRRIREAVGGRDYVGVPFGEVVSPNNQTLVAARRVYETGVAETYPIDASEMEGFRGRTFTNTVVPVRDPAGKVARVMVASVENTEQRRAQEALEAQARDLENARREAVEASQAKDEFLAMLGHELRNPLAPMVMTLDLMRLRGTTQNEIDVLERQVKHLTRLVDDLLDVSRIARGRVELKRRAVSLSTIVGRALEMTSPLIGQRRHRVSTDVASASVHVDPDRLAQVVANLITNAAKYSEVGAPIRVVAQESGARVTISVSDDGAGIAPEMAGKVFDAFVQQPQMLARSQGGLGLGLAIVKSLVEAHGGTVAAHSEGVGKGSTFIIDLPASAPAGAPVAAGPSETPPGPSPAPKRILVVDDNRDAAVALQSALQLMGHDVVVAHDGPSAVEAARTFKPELGLLDIGLPGMNGYELAVALRAAHGLRLVAVTGYGQERDRRRAREAGFDEHLVKPVELRQINQLMLRLAGVEPAS